MVKIYDRIMLKHCLFAGIIAILFAFGEISTASAQFEANPSNWLYPNGSPQGLRSNIIKSYKQDWQSVSLKWSTPLISGDVKPLIGNIVPNSKIFSNLPFAPNEIAAVVGERLVILDGKGKPLSNYVFPETVSGVIGLSALFDTLSSSGAINSMGQVVLGLETIEAQRQDTLAVAYIAGFKQLDSSLQILRRISINLRDNSFKPNSSASLKPIMARKQDNNFYVYATANMSKPVIGDEFFVEPPFLRGLAQFNAGQIISEFPLPDVGDVRSSRVTLGPEVSFAQASYTNFEGKNLLLLPTYPSPGMDDIIPNDITTGGTSPSTPYLLGFDLSSESIVEAFPLVDLSSVVKGNRPKIKSYYVDLNDNATGDSLFILVCEEYNGRDGSQGKSAIHLYDRFGNQLTSSENIDEPPYLPPSYQGKDNHYWSVATGDIDGYSANEWLPFFPNNRGKELVVTQSTREFAFAGSKLSILRYNSGPEISKPSPPDEYLFPFDTICTQKIKGWVACVNDFDGDDANGKEEIFLVDGSDIMVVRMRDYNDMRFRMGMPFDTVLTMTIPNQTISNLAIADVDGDGMNDMVVTTYDTTYVFGTPLAQTLVLNTPKYLQQNTSYCAGDTLTFEWENLINGSGNVDIYFIRNGQFWDSLSIVKIISNYPNMTEKGSYKYHIDNRVIGYSGYFVVANSSNPARNYDTSSYITFNKPALRLDNIEDRYFYSGSEINLSGEAYCLDSLAFEFSEDGTFWYRIGTHKLDSAGIFDFKVQLPCLTIFGCNDSGSESSILGRVIGLKSIFADSTNILNIKVKPSPFPVSMDSSETACPTKEFKWDPLFMQFPCDTVSILVSLDGGYNFSHIASVPAVQKNFIWKIPTGLRDTVMMRFCCEGSCIRLDTLMGGIAPKYIKLVAPNPFRIPEIMQLVYTVPEATRVNIRIFDQANMLVKEIVRSENREPNVVHCDYWDGYLTDGSPAANGMYYVSLEFGNGAREIYPVFIRK